MEICALHPDWDCRLWDDLTLMGEGVELGALFRLGWNTACISNFVRLILLKRYGGIYLDTDFEPFKPLDSLLEYDAVAALQDGDRVCNAFMGASPRHPWINWQLDNYRLFETHDAASGVYLATAAPRDLITIVQQHLIYPWMYDDPPEKRVPHPESLVAHHWAGSWTK